MSTSATASRENWPPSTWLREEGWSVPVVVDDQSQTVANAYGLTFFPFTVFVDSEGVVLGRLSGGIPIEDILNITNQVFQ